MQCANCGIEAMLGSAFCSSCGKPVPVVTTNPGWPTVASSGLQPNVAGALCYLAGFITGILFLVLGPYRHDQFVRFHAFQAIYFSAAWILLHIAFGVLLSLVPWTLWHLVTTLSSLLSLVFFGLTLFLMFKAYRNERFRLPLIGGLAEKQA